MGEHMSVEDIKPQEGGQPEPEQKQEREFSAIEQKAMELGWRPKEEFSGDEEAFVDAKEFVNRQPLFDKITSQSKHIKRVEQTLEALKQHQDKITKSAYEKAMRDLKAQQERAVEDGDLTQYHALNEKQKEIEQEHQELQATLKTPVEPQVHPELQEWIARNSWFETQPHMRVFADQYSDQFAAKVRAGIMTSGEALKEIEKAVRNEFPNKFRNPNKDKPSSVEGSSGKASSKTESFELSDQERKIMNTLTAMKNKDGTPFMTKEKYISELKQAKGL
jgi:hypothetical protein